MHAPVIELMHACVWHAHCQTRFDYATSSKTIDSHTPVCSAKLASMSSESYVSVIAVHGKLQLANKVSRRARNLSPPHDGPTTNINDATPVQASGQPSPCGIVRRPRMSTQPMLCHTRLAAYGTPAHTDTCSLWGSQQCLNVFPALSGPQL